MNLLKIMKLLAFNGVPTSMCYDFESEKYYVDLNTEAKSHLYLFEDGTIKGRYNYVNKIDFNQYEDDLVHDLCIEFKDSMHGKEYGSFKWIALCNELKIKI